MAERRTALAQLTLWKLREFLREPEALFWVFAFPMLLALALGVAFQNRGPQVAVVGVREGTGASGLAARLDSSASLRAKVYSAEEADQALRTGRISLIVSPESGLTLIYDSTRSESQLARLLVRRVLEQRSPQSPELGERTVTRAGARYIDFLIPGLIGLNIMGTGMWGVGFGIVRNRNQKLLKRLIASPMHKWEYLLAHLMFRLLFLGFEVGAVILFGMLVFGVPFAGSALDLAVVVVLGALAFTGLGLLTASRAKTLEGVSGLMNLVMVPMWIFSGVFFSYANFPDAFHPFIKALPLTALNDSLRAVMIDGTGLLASAGLLGIVALWAVASFGLALKWFRWV